MMFIYFLQRKYFLDGGDSDYLQNKLAASKKKGRDRFYSEFLKCLFFEGFAKPEEQRSSEARALLGRIKPQRRAVPAPRRRAEVPEDQGP